MPARRVVTSLAVAGILSILGCSDDGLGKRYAVTGKVTYKGQPVKRGSVIFNPEKEEGRGASSDIAEDGTYSLTTQTPGDGAFPGTYKVTIVSKSVDMEKVEAASKKLAEKAGVKATMPDPAMLARQSRVTKSEIPAKYASQDRSGLTREVKAESNTFDFALED